MATATESAILRALQAYGLQLGESFSLDWGIAYTCPRFPQLDSANQFREIIIEETEAHGFESVGLPSVFESVEEHFAQQGLKCRRWAPAVDQPLGKLEAFLTGRGFVCEDFVVMGLRSWADLEVAEGIRVLPARAMPKALCEILHEAYAASEPFLRDALVAAATERLDDPQIQGLVATLEGKPVGFGAFYEVGDIGLVTDVFVSEAYRRRGVGTALMDHILKLARRLMMRITCARVPADGAAAIELLRSCGMEADGRLTEFVAPPAHGLQSVGFPSVVDH
ncbi:MAG: GNAT family N-acetyltransferase [Phycisphaerae bacterium]